MDIQLTPHGAGKFWDLINSRVLSPLIHNLNKQLSWIRKELKRIEKELLEKIEELFEKVKEIFEKIEQLGEEIGDIGDALKRFLIIDEANTEQIDTFKENVGGDDKTASGDYALDERYYTEGEITNLIDEIYKYVDESVTNSSFDPAQLAEAFKQHHDVSYHGGGSEAETPGPDYWSHDDTYSRIGHKHTMEDLTLTIDTMGKIDVDTAYLNGINMTTPTW